MIVPSLFGVVAVFASLSAVGSVGDALEHPTTRAWLVALFGILRVGVALAFVVFTVGRGQPHHRAHQPIAYIACAAAIASVYLFGPPGTATPEGVLLAGDLIGVIAYIWLLASVLALGRCFGVLPEARGLVKRGPYALVRHPVYLGEIGACFGLAVASPSLGNGAALMTIIAAQSLRMSLEERALTEAFPDYASYAASTPRVLPWPPLLRHLHVLIVAYLHGQDEQGTEAVATTLPEQS